MNQVLNFINNSPVQYFATVGLDEKPKVRPFQFMLEDNGKLYFCTSNQKNVYREMSANPYVEMCCSGENFSWMRLSGKAVFSKDISLKQKVLETSPLVKSIYQTPENPEFEIFYLEQAVAVISDFSGNPPSTHRL